MSSIRLVYCFSKNLSFSEEQYILSLNLLKESVSLSSRLYDVVLYTDHDTIGDLDALEIPVINLGRLDLVFIDDFKVYILDKLDNRDLFVDSDVLIYNKLTFSPDVDLIFDFRDNPQNYWYLESLNKLKGTTIKSQINEISEVPFVPNLGFLKINSNELLTEYKIQYYSLRESIIKQAANKEPIGQFSMILGQYLLGAVLNKGKFSYFNISSENDSSVYRHLSGPAKFRKQQII